MKFKIAIIDDEEDARALLRIHLERHTHLELVGEASNGKQAIDLIRQQQPEIILLDINMPEMNGLELIQNLEAVPHFIFITAYNEYAIQAFELNAVDYLLKPFSTQRFDAALKRAVERARQGKMEGEIFRRLFQEISQSMDSKSYLQRITYRSGAKTFYLDTTQIVSIEAADQYVNIYTPEKKYLVRQSMDYLEQRLDPSVFFRTHRSFIIRLAAVESMEQFGPRSIWVHLKNGNKVKLSQVRKQLFLDKLRSV